MVFNHTFVQQAVCGASRASFLTGRRVETTRVYDLTSSFRDVGGDFVTLPQHFAEAGYTTRGFGKVRHRPTKTGRPSEKPPRDSARSNRPQRKSDVDSAGNCVWLKPWCFGGVPA